MASSRGTEHNQTPNVMETMSGSQTMGDKVHGQEGNSPDHQLRSPNTLLSGKGCGDVQTTRRLAQKQPSFKECVTAHWSNDSCAENLPGLSMIPKLWIYESKW